ncbi:unnamed protein product [Schistosoma mattheei]|uniref:Uncharacterized protein n=1 Tax=Schistosoma mattheei TaxID=31246 RepID=A0A183PDN4_9TREM|nr:unnamed protein product [Schistosoma mattheei]
MRHNFLRKLNLRKLFRTSKSYVIERTNLRLDVLICVDNKANFDSATDTDLEF